MNYEPVPHTASGTIEVPEHPGVRVTLADPPQAPFAADGLTLTAGLATATLLNSLQLGRLVMSGKASYTYYVLDFAATQHVASPDPNDSSSYTVLGVGLRLGFNGANVSGKASFSLGALAASANLSATATMYEVVTVGIGLDLSSLSFVQSLLRSSLGPFNVGTIQMIGAAFGEFSNYMALHSASATPQTIGVVLEAEEQLQSAGTSYGYALRAIEQNMTLDEAWSAGVNDLPAGVQRLDPVLAATYAQVLGTTDKSTQPSDVTNSQTIADQLDNCGP